MEESHTFRLTSDLSEVPLLREQFVLACRSEGVAGEELDAWMLVFTELVCNAIEHGCAHPGDRVQVRWLVDGVRVEVDVTDPGDCTGNLEALFDRKETDFSETGRGAGLILVRHFTDEISVTPGVAGGTRIRAVRFRQRRSPGGGAGGEL